VHKGRHFVNLFFEVRLLEPPETHVLAPDDGQVGLAWLNISELTRQPFFPRVLAARLLEMPSNPDAAVENLDGTYLGDSV
jgi:hypothetical protein